MAQSRFVRRQHSAAWLLLLGALTSSPVVHAQERAELEQLQATTMALIDVMVENGLITREKADQLLASAKAKAQAQVDAQQKQAAAAEMGKDGKRVVRVPYVPESVKTEMRDQIKQEVLTQARNERWGEPGAMPSWLQRFKFEGDMRLRYDMTQLGGGNTPPSEGNYLTANNLTRAADWLPTAVGGIVPGNTTEDFNRLRLRARLGITANVAPGVTGGLRLSTGNTSDRTSTNQTLGQGFNKYTLVLDQAYMTFKPMDDMLTLRGGRLPNPFFSTDLVWADDLGFEGVAGTFKSKPFRTEFFRNGSGFVTAGWFPLTESRSGATQSRSLIGVQGGLEMTLGRSDNRLKFGAAIYDYRNMEGMPETLARQQSASDYGTRTEYGAGLRQRGNTLFRTSYETDTTHRFGLASSFRELALTASLDLVDVLPQRVLLTGEFVKNLGFDRAEILSRTGVQLTDGKDYGFLAKVQVGEPVIAKRGQWNASLAYRYLGSDAVLDAFTSSDYGLGGTNNKGFMVGVNYGLYDNTWLSVRWLSSNLIDSMAPDSAVSTKLGVDALWFELNFRF
jgi:Putative porin